MTKDFYFQAADHLWNVLAEEKELPDAVRKLEGKELQEEKCIRLCNSAVECAGWATPPTND